MSIKISVISISYRPGYIDNIVASLDAQTFPHDQMEWVFVDELHHLKKNLVEDYIGGKFPLVHIPLEPSELSNTAQAINEGLCHARGELIYFMADYMYLHPSALERHWSIYQQYGPKVFISGPLLDRFTSVGQNIFETRKAVWHTVLVGNKPVTYQEYSPPLEWPIKGNYLAPTPENLISVWEKPFIPQWPKGVIMDWRTGMVAQGRVCIDDGLIDATSEPKWWWCGRNDSAAMESLLDANGLDESSAGYRAGLDSDLAQRMVQQGNRYLFDLVIPCYVLPHPHRKKERSDWVEAEVKLTGNTYSLRERREKVLCESS